MVSRQTEFEFPSLDQTILQRHSMQFGQHLNDNCLMAVVQINGKSARDRAPGECETSRVLKNGHLKREFPLFGSWQAMERYYDDVFGTSIDLIFAHNGVFPTLEADSSCGCQNRGDANEIVSGRREDEEPFDQGAATVPGPAEATNGFEPTETVPRSAFA